MSQGQRRLAAIMFTDMVGYTALAQQDESLALQLLERHQGIIRPLLEKHGGREVNTIGDAFLIEFESALEAMKCAIDMQEAFKEYNSKQGRDRIMVRIGIHVGDVVHRNGDILGDAVNIASRIESLARGGETCVSEQVYQQVSNKIDAKLDKLPPASLKNVGQQIGVYRLRILGESGAPPESSGLDKRRVAVLPLKSMSPDPADAYFADGMTEELITALSSVSGLTVIARTSVMQYKNSEKRVFEIGHELRAGTLVEGSVRKDRERIRVTIQLVDADSEGHLWAQNYDRQLDDIFAIQSEVAEKVAGTLKVRLVQSERTRLEAGPTTNVNAYTLYLKGRYFWNERTADGIGKAIRYFEEAVAKDPRFALGYAGLGDCYMVMRHNNLSKIEGGIRKAKRYASRALSIDSDLPEAQATMGMIHMTDEHDFVRAEEEFKRAIQLNPNYATAHQWYAHLLNAVGRTHEAVDEVRKALELDPLSIAINTNYADGLYYLGDFQGALDQLSKVRELFPEAYLPLPSMIQLLCRLGRFDEALGVVEEIRKKGKPIWGDVARAHVLAHTDKKRALQLISRIEKEDREGAASRYMLALASFVAGDADRGFALLERARKTDPADILNVAVDYELAQVRSDVRYTSLVKRLGLLRR
ncbi:MAG TPA: adenylate/guanylate cyclase domain-containing protein [Nitrososphaerales archaeon]|nr:adenylate/guanylate cyclase domain-containing protein [Nitrososphaerales archaeon]